MSMRSCVLLPVLLFLLVWPLKAETWYVRADGGTRASKAFPEGQCDGRSDAAYPGKGANRHCAFNDARWLWDDQHTYGVLKWAIAGGDTVILDNSKPWRVGFDTNGQGGPEHWCSGWSGSRYGCFNPPIPAGTPSQHTRILGRNYASCRTGSEMDKAKMSQMFGGNAVATVLNLNGAEFVDVECLEITRHSQCASHGEPRLPSNCNGNSAPTDDFDSDGVSTDVHTHDLLLQDMWIHGHTDRGIIGPIGGTVTANRIDISTNGMAGWDFDDGRSTPSVNAVMKMTYSIVEWNGCNQEYSATHPIPVLTCYGQSDGGYGDGIGTPAKDGMDVYIDHSIFRYNTQDGEDFGHIDSGSHKLSITNSQSYGNNGGQFKWGGGFTNVVFANNEVVGNCARLSQPMAGVPNGFNAHLQDFCRARDTVSFDMKQGATMFFDNNTIISYSPTTLDVTCDESSCSQSTLHFRNNIVLGFDNPATYSLGGERGGAGGFYFDKPIGHFLRSNNIVFGLRNGHCTATEVCKDPQFVGEPPRFTHESDLDHFNFHLSPSSPAVHAGAHISDLHTDFDGKSRPASGPYSVGALEQ